MVKLSLTLVNLLLLLLALAVFLLGVRISQRPSETVIIKEWMYTTSSILIVFGIALFIMTIVGLGGTLCSSSMLLHSYIYFLLVSTSFFLSTFACLVVFQSAIVKSASDQFKEMMANFSVTDEGASTVVQTLQSLGSCCGDASPDDWKSLNMSDASEKEWLKDGKEVPASCCGHSLPLHSLTNHSLVQLCSTSDLLYKDGCFSSVQVMRYQNSIIATFLALVLSLMLITTCACCLHHDRKLQVEKIRNLQYAAHLHTCSKANDAARPAF